MRVFVYVGMCGCVCERVCGNVWMCECVWICECVWMCVREGVCVDVLTPQHMCGGPRTTLHVIPHFLPCLSQGLFALPYHEFPRIIRSLPPILLAGVLGLQMQPLYSCLLWALGIHIQALILYGKCFTN